MIDDGTKLTNGNSSSKVDGALPEKILRMFAIYTALISALRLMGLGRIVYGIVEGSLYARSGMAVGGYLFAALPIVIAVYSYTTRLNEKSRLSIMVFSFLGILNHLFALLMVMANFAWSYMMAPAFFRIGGPLIVGGAAVFMGVLFKYCRDLGKFRQDDSSKQSGDWDALVISVVIGAVFLLSYSLKESPILMSEQLGRSWSEKDVKLIELEDCRRWRVVFGIWGFHPMVSY